MRAGKRAARREVQKHIDFTEGHYLAKKSLHQRIGSFLRDSLDVNLRFSSNKRRTTSHAVTEVRNFTFSLQRFLLDPPL